MNRQTDWCEAHGCLRISCIQRGLHRVGDPEEDPMPTTDLPLPEDAEIKAAHPLRTGRHDLYAEAMRLVGAKHSKGALVELVNWQLHENAALQKKLEFESDCLAASIRNHRTSYEEKVKLRSENAKQAEILKEYADVAYAIGIAHVADGAPVVPGPVELIVAEVKRLQRTETEQAETIARLRAAVVYAEDKFDGADRSHPQAVMREALKKSANDPAIYGASARPDDRCAKDPTDAEK